ncbi:MAG: cupin domain-containing protein [Candidatus Dormibacteraceae bacterium]
MSAEIHTKLPIPLAIAGHHQPAPFYLTTDMFGGLPVQLAGGELSGLVDHPVADLHTHQVDEIYLVISPTPGGAVIDVELDGEHHTLVSPAVMRVPAGGWHRFVTKKAERGSYCFGLLVGTER